MESRMQRPPCPLPVNHNDAGNVGSSVAPASATSAKFQPSAIAIDCTVVWCYLPSEGSDKKKLPTRPLDCSNWYRVFVSVR
jgi:hypothetical protein